MRSLLFIDENQKFGDRFTTFWVCKSKKLGQIKVKTFLRSYFFETKIKNFKTNLLLFGYKNQENQDKFKVKTFFRENYIAPIKQNQLFNVALELKSLPMRELN